MRKTILIGLISILSINAKSQNFVLTAILDQEVSCKGNKDGSIQASCSPEGDYKYVISRGAFTDSNPSGVFRDLVPGVYKISATNGKVTKYSKVTVTEPKSLGIKFGVIKYPTNDSRGAISLEVSGGTTELQPYLITWNDSQGNYLNPIDNPYSLYMEDLKAGIYTVKIEDDHGCFLTKSFKLPKKK